VRNVIQENVPLAPLTTLGIGGPARYFFRASTERSVVEAIGFARSRSLPMMILGGGSNLLVSDDGFPGLVLSVALKGVTRAETDGGVRVRAGAGVDWDALVADCVGCGLYGVECLSGIPGWVGGTPIQNVGAYGQEVADVISGVRVFDLGEGAIAELPTSACGFAYRTSLFNTTARGRYVVLAVDYFLETTGQPGTSYPDLRRFFEGRSAPPGLTEVREAVRAIRRQKAMLLVDGDPDRRSAGSFFRNPVVSASDFGRMEEQAQRFGASTPVPRYTVDAGVKVPAAWLIEQSGFPRGTTEGAVGLSSKHALALVNRGGATAEDVLRFAARIQQAVEDAFGVRLRTEPAFVGFPEEVTERFGAVVG